MILLLLLLFTPSQAYSAYFADFSALAQDREPTCVPIPQNMSLCSNIGYTKMRLPNLLEHDTIQEASSQATYWVPLTHAQCAEDTQLFLCSLFAPVCLERPIYPCRSLCQKVKAGCEEKMSSQGYPWPSMLDCDKFPLDNDMCITSQAEAQQGRQSEKDVAASCSAELCNQAPTFQNIMKNFCQADFVAKIKFKKTQRKRLIGRKTKSVYKLWRGTREEMKKFQKPKLHLETNDECCSDWIKSHSKKTRFLVMGKKPKNQSEGLVPTFILPWSRDKEMKRARRMFKQVDCNNLPDMDEGENGGDRREQRRLSKKQRRQRHRKH